MTLAFAEHFHQRQPGGQIQQPAHEATHDEICTAKNMSLLRSRKDALYSHKRSSACAPVLSGSLPWQFALRVEVQRLLAADSIASAYIHISQVFVSSFHRAFWIREEDAGKDLHTGKSDLMIPLSMRRVVQCLLGHILWFSVGSCNPQCIQGTSGRLVASSALCCSLRNQSSLITGCSRSVDGGEGLGLRDAARYEGGAVEPVSLRTRLFRATVLPVGFEVRCVDRIEIIEDELDDDGLSTVSISTSFSENSIRGSNDAVLLIFSGMRAIR